MNLELDDKELMKLYKERAEKAENGGGHAWNRRTAGRKLGIVYLGN